jgi:hypothetical protein
MSKESTGVGGRATGAARDSLIQAYYLATPLFWLLDVLFHAPIRVAALPQPGLRLLYYVFALGCGVLVRWRPRLTPFVGLAESSMNLLLLILSVLLPIFTLPTRVAEGAEISLPFGPAMLINFFLSGTLLVISFYRNQERITESIRVGILGQRDDGGK